MDQFNVAQTHVSDPFVHVSSNPAQAIYAYEANFISDIQKEVSAHKITGDQAVTQLAGFAHEFPNQQSVVANEIAALINNHQVTAVHAASDIGAAVTSHAMNADDAIGLLANLGAHPGPGIQSNAAGEIAWLVGQPYAAHVLIGMSAHGNAVVQADVHNAISVTSSRLTSAVRLTRPD